MSVTEDLTSLAERANRDLNRVHDFFEHTQQVWRSFAAWVDEGNSLTSINPATGTTVTQEDLVKLSRPYVAEYLVPFTFQRFVSIFEGYVFDLLRVLLANDPRRLSRKQVDLATVLAAPDREAVVLAVIDRELNEVKYGKLRDWFAYLEGPGVRRKWEGGGCSHLGIRHRSW
jgi:hypothetical protein